MTQSHTIQDVGEYTGLKIDFIRKCIKHLSAILEPYISRGDKNCMLFDSNALVIFDQVKQLKERGFILNSIEQELSKQLPNMQQDSTKQPIQTQPNSEKDKYLEMLINELKEIHKTVLLAKDETIQTQRLQINTLEKQILLLTDGRSPEEIKREQEDREEEGRTAREHRRTLVRELAQV